MIVIKRLSVVWSAVLLLLALLAACRSSPSPTVVPATPTPRIVERTVVVTRIITEVVTREPEAPRTDLVLCLRDEPDSLDPLFVEGEDGQSLRGLFGAMPVAVDPKGAWWSGVFEQVPTLENGGARLVGEEGPDGHLEMTYHIRPDLRWEDGQPVKAADFRQAWEAARSGRGVPSIQAKAADVADVVLQDERTFTVILRDGLMSPLYPTYVFGPYPGHMLQKDLSPDDLARRWPSYGPFRLARWTPSEMLFVRNPEYTGPAPALTQVRVRFFSRPLDAIVALMGGECDVLSPRLLDATAQPLLDAAQKQGRIAYTHVPGSAWVHLDFNTWPPSSRPPFFADVRVRKAVLLALDRSRLRQEATLGLGTPMASWLLPQFRAYRPQPALEESRTDCARAASLLDTVGWRDENGDGVREAHGVSGTFWDGTEWSIDDGVPFSVTLLTVAGDAVLEQAAFSVRDQLAPLGLRVHVKTLPPKAMFAPDSPLWHRTFDLALFAWESGVDPDGRYLWLGNTVCRRADGTLYTAQAGRSCEPGDETLHPPTIPTEENGWAGGNVVGWANPDASLAVYEATSHLDEKTREESYARHQAAFAQDLPTIPLFQRPRLVAWRRGWAGIRVGPFTPLTWNVESWHYER